MRMTWKKAEDKTWMWEITPHNVYWIVKVNGRFVWYYRFRGSIQDNNYAGAFTLQTAKRQCKRHAERYGLLTYA